MQNGTTLDIRVGFTIQHKYDQHDESEAEP
jgi:hypothetical protein